MNNTFRNIRFDKLFEKEDLNPDPEIYKVADFKRKKDSESYETIEVQLKIKSGDKEGPGNQKLVDSVEKMFKTNDYVYGDYGFGSWTSKSLYSFKKAKSVDDALNLYFQNPKGFRENEIKVSF